MYRTNVLISQMHKHKKKSLKRISRNKEIYYAIFKEGSLDVLECWLGCPKDLEKKIDVNLTKRDKPNKNEHSHVGDSLGYCLLGGGEMRRMTRGTKTFSQPVVAQTDFNVFA